MPPKDIAEIVSFFNNEFIPAYSDLTGFIVNKPQEILIGIEYAFSHLMQHFNEDLGLNRRIRTLRRHIITSRGQRWTATNCSGSI
jgi:hypothetical protein